VRTLRIGVFFLWTGASPVGAVAVLPAPGFDISIPPSQVRRLGRKIWHNECRGTSSGLTSWNRGEEFASLGIGHFIWYPEGRSGPFQESFPQLLAFLERHGAVLPDWLTVCVGCPWPSRRDFQQDFHSQRMDELRRLLAQTVPLQARFIVERLEGALPRMLAGLAPDERRRVRSQFYRVARQPAGVYALVDYVNFKGEGLKAQENYNGEAWGLLQVLQGMNGTLPGRPALEEFAQSADRVLTRRVQNSPPDRHEALWLPGWRQRLQTYRAPTADS